MAHDLQLGVKPPDNSSTVSVRNLHKVKRDSRRVSWFATILAIGFLCVAVFHITNPQIVEHNRNIREGMHKVLGRPHHEYSLALAAFTFYLVPAAILLVLAFRRPRISQSIVTVIGSSSLSIVVTSCIFGTLGSGLLFYAVIAFLLLCYGFWPFDGNRKSRRNRPTMNR
ncbi:MAG: hypothetical protein ACKVII_16555 [Planctomycetales bacterium]|jgi:positive regulator of sigma E activity